jgi:hypothetical protein
LPCAAEPVEMAPARCAADMLAPRETKGWGPTSDAESVGAGSPLIAPVTAAKAATSG